MGECVFCLNTRFKNNKLVNLPADESILFENENLYVIPDIAPLTDGHILIITNEHYTNFYSVPKEIKEQVEILKNNIRKVFKEKYQSDTLFFEHGSLKSGEAGSSIEHAHLHAVPYSKPIKEKLDKLLNQGSISCNIIREEKPTNPFPYLYIEDELDGNHIYKVDKLPTQFLRKFMAELQYNDEYKWQNLMSGNCNYDVYNRIISNVKGNLQYNL